MTNTTAFIRNISILTGITLLACMSCATVGRDFPTDTVAQIQIGKTTLTEINELFGPPWRTGVEDGDKTWTYGYYKYRLFGDSTTRDLVVRFDERGVVNSYSYNTSEIE